MKSKKNRRDEYNSHLSVDESFSGGEFKYFEAEEYKGFETKDNTLEESLSKETGLEEQESSKGPTSTKKGLDPNDINRSLTSNVAKVFAQVSTVVVAVVGGTTIIPLLNEEPEPSNQLPTAEFLNVEVEEDLVGFNFMMQFSDESLKGYNAHIVLNAIDWNENEITLETYSLDIDGDTMNTYIHKEDFYYSIEYKIFFDEIDELIYEDYYYCIYTIDEFEGIYEISRDETYERILSTYSTNPDIIIDYDTLEVSMINDLGEELELEVGVIDESSFGIMATKYSLFSTYDIQISYHCEFNAFEKEYDFSFSRSNVNCEYGQANFGFRNHGSSFDGSSLEIAYSFSAYDYDEYFKGTLFYTLNSVDGQLYSNTKDLDMSRTDGHQGSGEALLSIDYNIKSVEYYYQLEYYDPNHANNRNDMHVVKSETYTVDLEKQPDINISQSFVDVSSGQMLAVIADFSFYAEEPVSIFVTNEDDSFICETDISNAYYATNYRLNQYLDYASQDYYLKMYTSDNHELIKQELLATADTEIFSNYPDAYMNCPNPGDYLITYNEDNSFNAYAENQFTVNDSKGFNIYGVLDLVTYIDNLEIHSYYTINQDDDLISIEYLLPGNYYLNYYLCVDWGQKYIISNTTPSGGFELERFNYFFDRGNPNNEGTYDGILNIDPPYSYYIYNIQVTLKVDGEIIYENYPVEVPAVGGGINLPFTYLSEYSYIVLDLEYNKMYSYESSNRFMDYQDKGYTILGTIDTRCEDHLYSYVSDL